MIVNPFGQNKNCDNETTTILHMTKVLMILPFPEKPNNISFKTAEINQTLQGRQNSNPIFSERFFTLRRHEAWYHNTKSGSADA